jgi:hypothetical protein
MADNKIEWEEDEPGLYFSLCGRFTMRQDPTYGYFNLCRTSDDELIGQGWIGEMTKLAESQPVEAPAS